ncbi:MAG: FxSxx-COOH system tetratricopeptide repeat protein [Streptosporangiaceae bacterium]
MAFVVDDLGAWLIGLLADAGRRKLVTFVLGDEQVRALYQACRAALAATAAELRPGDAAAADEVAMVVGEVFKAPAPQPAAEHGTLLEDLRAGIAARLAVLDDPGITTESGWSSADALGVSAAAVAEKLASRLVREITGRGARGGPLEPLASQFGHDRSFLQGLRLEGKIDQMDSLLAAMLAVLGEARPGTRGQQRAGAGPVLVGDVPQQPPGFVPRAELLGVLDAAGPGVSAVTGLRGVGKTQLAAAYARAKLAAGWDLVGWVNAEDAAVLAAGLAAVAEAAGLAGQGSGDPGRAVRHWLEAGGDRCLIVFDNATDPDVLRPFVPAGGAARVLITSNRRSVADLGATVGVEVFSEEEALAFLADRTALADPAGAAAVAAELGCLPLALAQAAAVMAGQHLGYGRYLERLRALPVREHLTRDAGQPYPHGVAEAVLLSLDAVRAGDQDGVCAGVLEVMAVVSAAGVRRELLYEAGKAGVLSGDVGEMVAAGVVDRALARLAEASLLTFSLDGQTVSAHRLVLRVVRDGLARQQRLAAVCLVAAAVLDARARALKGSLDRLAVRDIPEQVTALQETIASCASGAGEELARMLLGLRLRALYHLLELGDSAAQAIVAGEPLVADCEWVLGPDHPHTLTSRDNLATAYQTAGRAAEAIPLHEQTLAARERVLGPDHPSTLTSRNNLAETYRAAGRVAEAIPLHKQTLAARERVLGPDHPHTLTSRNNLAAAYQTAGRAAEAIPLHEQTLAARERVLGPDHPHTLSSRNNLAAACRVAGRVAEAVALYEQTLAACERVLGPDHPHTLSSRNNLAAAYRAAGRAD